jgi:ABC-type transport system substrate-binding protein
MRIVRTNTLGAPGMIRMNHIHPPFNDPRARQALMQLVNQEEFLQAMFPDPSLYQVCHAFFVCGSPQETNAGVPAGLGSPAARERARQLLRESGYDGSADRHHGPDRQSLCACGDAGAGAADAIRRIPDGCPGHGFRLHGRAASESGDRRRRAAGISA